MSRQKNDWKALREIAILAKEYSELAETHDKLAQWYNNCGKIIQAAIIILSGIGTFVNSLPISGVTKSVTSSCCSGTTGILSSVYVVFGLGKRGIKHDDIATGFKSLEKSLRLQLLKPSTNTDEILELIDFCETTREKLLKHLNKTS